MTKSPKDTRESESLQFGGIIKFLVLPAIVAAILATMEPSVFKVAIFAVGMLVLSLVFPWLKFAGLPEQREVLNSKSVDLVYYSLAIVGTFFFYLANSISSGEYENRKAVSDAYKDLAFLQWFNPDLLFNQQEYLDALKLGLLDVNKQYLDREDGRVDECAPQNFEEYDFCTDERNTYGAAQSHVERGFVSVARQRQRSANTPSMEISREVLARMEPLGIPIRFEHKRFGVKTIVFRSTTLFDYLFLRGDGAKLLVDRGFEEDIQPLIAQAEARIDYLEDEYLEIRSFGAISGISFFLGNTWPYVLLMALSLKLSRTRYSMPAYKTQ